MMPWRKLMMTVFLLISFASPGLAAEVLPNRARLAAENWLQYSLADQRLAQHKNYKIVREEVIACNDQTGGYNYILSPKGHIIVPSREELPVVKLYSFTTTLSMSADSDIVRWIKGELCGVNAALDKHSAELAGVDRASTRNGRLWKRFGASAESFALENDFERAAGETVSMGPLISTVWAQGDPFNQNTPLWYNGDRTVTGCVATAAAQIMKYWNYPATGQGSTSYTWNNGSADQTLSANFAASAYDWSNMLNDYRSGGAAAQKAAVAKLMSDVGIAFHMKYGTSSGSGSGADTLYGSTVFPTYFKYKNTVSVIYRSSSSGSPFVTSDSAFMQVFKTETQAGRPSQLRIKDPGAGGHSIVVDGYRDSPSEQIHLNMGWESSYDGWYASNNIVTGSYSWSNINYQAAVIGIEPPDNPIPDVGSVSPALKTAGDASFVLTVNGGNFVNGSVVRWNGSARTTTYVSATQLTATITAADIATAGTFPVHVFNPIPGGGTSTTYGACTVSNTAPAIAGLMPSSATKGGAAFILTVNGSNFVNGSVVNWNGSARTTTYVSAIRLTAAITAADIASAGTGNVTVFNPAPGGGTSGAATFTISEPSKGGGGDSGGGGCFIATAAFGTPLEKHVQILRDFRDRCLLKTSAGRAFVKFYYEFSPPVAGTIARSEGLRFMTRCGLMPFVGMAYLTITYGAASVLLTMSALILILGALFLAIRRRMTIVQP